jgi:2-(1,2-epoxy-1,2-dihydrophenyl)acetyl-CoA isomerase
VSSNTVRVSFDGPVALVTLSDPSTMNAASIEMAQELTAALTQCVETEGVRVVVLTGEGRGFCSGANLSGTGPARELDEDGKPDAGAALEAFYNPLVTRIRELPVPIVTAVNGAAAGVGCSLALLGDIIIAAESAFFLQAFTRIGLVPDGGSTYLLPRMIGRARAMEMTLLAERLPARTALEWGLINRCVPDAELMTAAMDMAKRLAAGPKALGMTRRLMWDSLESDWKAQLHSERQAQRVAGKTRDFAEGVTAFREKRPAAFSGR